MNSHNKKMLKNIQLYFQEYLDKKIDLPTLQSGVNAVWSNLENDVDKRLRDKIFYFVEELEGIRFSYSDEKHFNLVLEEIEDLDSAINAAIKETC